MIEYIEIGPVPCNEPCAQVGEENFKANARREMNAYINQLERKFPDASANGVEFVMKWYPHDFGTYGEVCIAFFLGDEYSEGLAYDIERQLPEDWDTEARKELSLQ